MSRLLTLLRSTSLPALAEDCNRLAAQLREELAAIRRETMPQWYRRKDRPPLTPATPVAQAKFGEVLFFDATAADVEFWLPMATEADAWRSVAFVKRNSTNDVIARVVPPNLIHEADQLATTQGGFNVFVWDGVGNWWRQRG
jgi:hypothetical protein